jgi:hypothetical protein
MQLIRPLAISQANLTSNIPIDDGTEYSAALTYALGDRVINTTGTDPTFHVYESLIDANHGNDFLDPSFWLDLGTINRLAMFDQVVGTLTTNDSGLIDVTITSSTVSNGIAFFNLAGATDIQITVSNSSGTLYDETVDLRSTFGITDWYSWFTQEVEFATDKALTNLPPYSGVTVRVQITGGDTVSCGTMVLGKLRDLGSGPEYGARGGIIDYSRKETDTFGNTTLVERPFAKRWTFTTLVPAGDVDGIFNVLSTYRATPVAWIGSEDYSSTLIFGWARDWNEEITYPSYSLLSLEIEGLI